MKARINEELSHIESNRENKLPGDEKSGKKGEG